MDHPPDQHQPRAGHGGLELRLARGQRQDHQSKRRRLHAGRHLGPAGGAPSACAQRLILTGCPAAIRFQMDVVITPFMGSTAGATCSTKPAHETNHDPQDSALVLGLAACCQAAVVIDITPASAVPALPGQTVGWGITITITITTEYLVPTAVTFTPFPGAGVFTDILTDILLVVGPGPLESPLFNESFDLPPGTGLATFAVDPLYLNALLLGTITVEYDLFSRSPNDPLFDPVTDALALGQSYQQGVSINVLDPHAVPEPATAGLLMVALGWIIFRPRRG